MVLFTAREAQFSSFLGNVPRAPTIGDFVVINVHTDKHIQGREDVAERVQSLVEDAVGHFSEVLTRVDVHLSDENGGKSGTDDKRCLIEASPKGLPSFAVHYNAGTVLEAIDGASEKLSTALEKLHGKRLDRQRHPKVAAH